MPRLRFGAAICKSKGVLVFHNIVWCEVGAFAGVGLDACQGGVAVREPVGATVEQADGVAFGAATGCAEKVGGALACQRPFFAGQAVLKVLAFDKGAFSGAHGVAFGLLPVEGEVNQAEGCQDGEGGEGEKDCGGEVVHGGLHPFATDNARDIACAVSVIHFKVGVEFP